MRMSCMQGLLQGLLTAPLCGKRADLLPIGVDAQPPFHAEAHGGDKEEHISGQFSRAEEEVAGRRSDAG